MIFGRFQAWRIASAGALMAMSLAAAENFVPPAEGPVAFRRDRLPLDASVMANVSRQLVILAEAQDGDTPGSRRAAAQMLGLATALDPGNGRAREVIANFKEGRHSKNTDAGQIQKFRDALWHDIDWLQSPEAGSQGQALAACLADVLAISDPKDPKSGPLLAAGEQGAWKRWIPELDSYRDQEVVKEVVKEEMALEPTKLESVKPDLPRVLLKHANVKTVVWSRVAGTGVQSGETIWAQDTASLEMDAEQHERREDEGPMPFSLMIGGSSEGTDELTTTLLALLKKQYGTLPLDVRVQIKSSKLGMPLPSTRRQSISAAAAVLASAAITGLEPDATILGVVEESGRFKLPAGFWDQLQALGSGNGGRLILPAAAADYLPAMLALEKPQLFFNYEVLLAADFPDLLRLSAKTPDDATARFMAKFREIREKANLQLIGQYVANPFVRKRLVEITQDAPFHYSAKLLAIQGAGGRPTLVPAPVLAAELRRAIKPAEWLTKQAEFDLELNVGRLSNTGDLCRKQVDALARYVDKDGRVLFGKAQKLLDTIRAFERILRMRGDYYLMRPNLLTAHAELTRAYGDASAEITVALGEDPVVHEH